MTQLTSEETEATTNPAREPRVGILTRFWTLVISHGVVDIYPIFFSSLLWPLQARLDLSASQVTAVIMATPIFSGALQPLFAWLTDKHDTRLCGPAGLAIGGACIGSIGFATSFEQLIALQIVGVIGCGMYHPIATAVAGQTGSSFLRNGRAQAIGIFISAGMAGHATGAILSPAINDRYGMERLVWLIPPALIMAIVFHVMLRHIPHRHDNHREMHAAISPAESRRRWIVVGMLAAQNALRFIVNVGLMVVMFNVWAMSKVLATTAESTGKTPAELLADKASAQAVAKVAALEVGYLSAALTIGMGIGVLLVGRFVKPGTEKRPLIILSLVGAVFTAVLGLVGDTMHDAGGFSTLTMIPVYLCVALTPLGFFATFPIATSLAQRLQPAHTGVVTSLMMGMGWTIAAACAPLAVVFFGMTSINDAPLLEPWRINIGFYGFAALLVVAGVSTLAIPNSLIEKAAEHH